eukprot:TRINITY_DN14305_c0_g2_i1.p1 TRINITY_DN14305_c0_g2~~TRINITY_DN14305_c0_g2_i1.p1  ORF type:complete len:399 (-),score=52.47 TRINITY_DN14305_c0_g2_i1:453-1649(-)
MARFADEKTKLLHIREHGRGSGKILTDAEAPFQAKKREVELPEGWKDPLSIITVATLACAAIHIAFISIPVYQHGGLKMSMTLIFWSCALLLLQRCLVSGIRYMAMRHLFGLDHAAVMESVFQASPGDLEALFEKTEKMKLRALDGIIRKSYHCIIWSELCMLHVNLHLNQEVFHLVSIAISFFNIIVPLFLVNCDNVLAYGWWGSSVRVWDGHSKRSNSLLTAVTGSYWALVALWIANNFFVRPVLSVAAWGALPYTMITIPVLVGDAVAELVGASFGRHTFQVSGLGEINQKSLEGCMGFVLSTTVVLFYLLDNAGVRSHEVYFSALLMSVTTMVAETFSFRGTDNFFIILVGGFSLGVSAQAFWPVKARVDMTYSAFLTLSSQPVFQMFWPGFVV